MDSTNLKAMHALMKKRGTNQLDDLTTGLVNSMSYSNSDVVYPEFTDVKPGQDVKPEWFYVVYRGANGFSELNAINQYISQEAMFDEIGELMLGIALVEMKHMDKLGDFILKLEGKVTQEYNTSHVDYGKTARQAVAFGVESEQRTIAEYKKIAAKVSALPENKTTKVTLQLLAKLIADEEKYLSLFENWLEQNK
ncbi:MAG: hypothetical protein LUE93_03995 [Bacteroides sp.]|nr:hypothetical protein [Bacteroides sp.]